MVLEMKRPSENFQFLGKNANNYLTLAVVLLFIFNDFIIRLSYDFNSTSDADSTERLRYQVSVMSCTFINISSLGLLLCGNFCFVFL